MHEGAVEEGTLGQSEVGDGVAVVEAFDIWPVLLRCGGPKLGRCGFNCPLMTLHCCMKCHLTTEHLREDLVEVGLLATDDGAIRQGDVDRWHLHTGCVGASASAARKSNSCGHFRGFLALATFPSEL